MSVAAQQTVFRDETIALFEVHESPVRMCVTTEVMIEGSQATFLVAGSDGEMAGTRGADGFYAVSQTSNTQVPITLTDYGDVTRRNNFDIFASQGNQREIMQKAVVSKMNRRISHDVYTALNTATLNTGAAAAASEDMVLSSYVKLQNNDVAWDDGYIWSFITPAFNSYLLKIPSFASADYVSLRPVETAGAPFTDGVGYRHWQGVNFIVRPDLPGVGTNAEKCFMFHKSAIGHAMDSEQLDIAAGYDEEQAYSWARASGFMGSAVLQNSGIIVMNHDGSAFA